MTFELGKTYIVDVTEKGIIPLMEFDDSEWYKKDQDDLDFLTDEEKEVIITSVLDKIRTEIEKAIWEDAIISRSPDGGVDKIRIPRLDPDKVLGIIDKYKAESEE